MLEILRSLVFKNFWTKLVAAILAVSAYVYVTNLIQRTYAFDFVLVPEGTDIKRNAIVVPDAPGLIIVPEPGVGIVQIELTGTAQEIERLRRGQVVVGLIPPTLFQGRLGADAPTGRVTVDLNDIEFPDYLRDLRMNIVGRTALEFVVSRRRTEQMRVVVEVDRSDVPSEYEVGVPKLSPTFVDVSGPSTWFERNAVVALSPIKIPPTQTDDIGVRGKLPEEVERLGVQLAEEVDVEIPIQRMPDRRKMPLAVHFLLDGSLVIPEEFVGRPLREIFSLVGNDGYDTETNTLEVTLEGPAVVFDNLRTKEILENEPILFLTIASTDFVNLQVEQRYLHVSDKLPPEIRLIAPEKVDLRFVHASTGTEGGEKP